MTKHEVLQQCTVNGNVIKLPDSQLDRNLYLEVKKSLELIGGIWKGGKVFGFVFPSDPSELLESIAGGENRNLKKEFQFFYTPNELGLKVAELAEINPNICDPEQLILEPEAGQGHLVEAIKHYCHKDQMIHCFELMETNRIILKKRNDVILLGEDFLNNDFDKQIKFDRIIANPPFNKNQDIDHIYEMYKYLKKGGRLVSIASEHSQISTNKKESDFRLWLSNYSADIYPIDKGSFKESGTLVGAVIIVIDKI